MCLEALVSSAKVIDSLDESVANLRVVVERSVSAGRHCEIELRFLSFILRLNMCHMRYLLAGH